jgi:hypothetical protein
VRIASGEERRIITTSTQITVADLMKQYDTVDVDKLLATD